MFISDKNRNTGTSCQPKIGTKCQHYMIQLEPLK